MDQNSGAGSESGGDIATLADIRETLPNTPFLSRIIHFHSQERAKFTVHEQTITKTSQVFRAMLNQETKESSEGIVDLPETTAATFAFFLEFAYSGTYNISGQKMQTIAAEDEDIDGLGKRLRKHAPNLPDNAESIADVVLELRMQNEWKILDEEKGIGKGRTVANTEKWMQYRFVMAHPSEDMPRQKMSSFAQEFPACTWECATAQGLCCWRCIALKEEMIACKPVLGLTLTLAVDSYYDLLMPHVEIWIFADLYDVPKLRRLSLLRMHQLLKYQQRPTNEDQVEDLVGVVQYLFEHTREGAILRTLFVDYIAAIAKGCKLLKNAAFRELMQLPAFSVAYIDTCVPIMHGTNIVEDD